MYLGRYTAGSVDKPFAIIQNVALGAADNAGSMFQCYERKMFSFPLVNTLSKNQHILV